MVLSARDKAENEYELDSSPSDFEYDSEDIILSSFLRLETLLISSTELKESSKFKELDSNNEDIASDS